MSDKSELRIHIKFDDDAKRWFVARSDVPGLRLEADTPGDLIRRITEAVSELIELNEARQEAQKRPAVRWKPVFDSSLELQSAH